MTQITGFAWAGPILETGGYGSVSRNLLKSLALLDIPIHLYNIGKDDHIVSQNDLDFFRSIQTPLEYLGSNPILIINHLPHVFSHLDKQRFFKSIGVTVFETDRIPDGWAHYCNQMDQIWIPSQFNKQTFTQNGVQEDKIQVIPYPIDVNKYSNYKRNEQNKKINKNGDKFTFLFVGAFDYRKGLDLLISSFCSEFSTNENVQLIVKLFIPHWIKNEQLDDLLKLYFPHQKIQSNVIFIFDTYNDEEMYDLYRNADCYVSTERANGWGYPPMEMMALGKPVIHINWGGNTEFMTQDNAFLIPVSGEMEPVSEQLVEQTPLYRGHFWAKVNQADVQMVMRDVFMNNKKRLAVGTRARKDIAENYNFESISLLIKESLQFI